MTNSSISHSICIESNKLYKNSVGGYPYAIKLAHNNCKISYIPNEKLMKLKIENEVLRKLHPHTFQNCEAYRGDIDRT